MRNTLCDLPTAFGRCIAPAGHSGTSHPTRAHLALFSASLVAQLEQAQHALRTLPLTSGVDEDEEWAYAFDTAVPMIYGGYLI